MLLPLLLALSCQSTPPSTTPPGPTRIESHGLWSLGFSGYRRIAPADDLVVLSQTDGVYGNDAATGVSRWARKDLAEGFGVPTVAGSSLYVGAAQGADSKVTTKQATYALDVASGETRWTSSFWAYEGVVDAGAVVVGIGATACGGELAVVALRASDGEVAWSTPLPGLWKTAPRPQRAGDFVLCRTHESVAALRATDGAVAWRTPDDSACLDYGVHGDVVVLLGEAEGRKGSARAVSVTKGELLWTAALSGPSTGIAFVAGDALVATWDGEVARLDLATGKDRWRAKLADGSTVDPLVVGDVALACQMRRGTDGKKARTWSAIDLGTGAVRGDVLVVGDKDALIADDHQRLWWSRPEIGKLEALELRRAP